MHAKNRHGEERQIKGWNEDGVVSLEGGGEKYKGEEEGGMKGEEVEGKDGKKHGKVNTDHTRLTHV